MPVSHEFLRRCAAETGFRIPTLEKVVRLGELAAAVTSHPYLGPRLLLKGGTPLNLCFGPPPRLSVDLDYNYVGEVDREAMLLERPQVERTLEALAVRLGYQPQRSRDAAAGRAFYLRHVSVPGGEGRIKVDLNFLFREPLLPPVERELWQPGALDRPRIRMVSLTELCIGKMLALLDRVAVRDVWDVASLTDELLGVVQTSAFRRWFLGLAAILPRPLSGYGRERIEASVAEGQLEDMVLPMLTDGAGADPATLPAAAWSTMEPLLALSPAEREYHAAIGEGRFRGDLLFPDDPGAVEQLQRHPALRWKLQNVREYLARKGLDS